jgi:hypothetical protein
MASWVLKYLALIAAALAAWGLRAKLAFLLLTSAEERRLFSLVNDARKHPEKYPPRGNAEGAVTTACPSGFKFSIALTQIAQDHNNYLKDQPGDWVDDDDNMHRGPSGKLVWELGEPMEQAGYDTYRAENQALGYATPEEVVTFWMRDDAAHGWGHRNAILRCETLEAGVGHYKGGPKGHYWTLDMGTK